MYFFNSIEFHRGMMSGYIGSDIAYVMHGDIAGYIAIAVPILYKLYNTESLDYPVGLMVGLTLNSLFKTIMRLEPLMDEMRDDVPPSYSPSLS